ncbi:MAG TPA: GNAT family N-acetyltransferase [Acidimicrobiales bacterium]|nr:GNAT family N-acetyltransferase [Acidimicrobiales bacterium]
MDDAQAAVVARRGRTADVLGSVTVEFLSGPTLLDELGADLDDLHEATGTPVTARTPWLRAWVGAYAPEAPWAIAVRDACTDRLDGVALLSSRPHAGWDEITPLGRRQLDRGVLPARSAAAADALGTALAARLSACTRPWSLRVGQLPADDPVAATVVRRLEGARTLPGLPIPKVALEPATSATDLLGKGLRKQLRKARNRLADDGIEATVDFVADPAEVELLLAEVERTHRAREHHAHRVSDLESSPGLRFWRCVILDHARRGEVEVATLRLGDELAAYVVSLLDGDVHRVFDGRLSPAWSRFSPGRLLETATLERAVVDPRYRELDWMNGCASEKLLTANAADPTEHLVAASPGLVIDLDVIGHAPAAVDHRTLSNLASGAR